MLRALVIFASALAALPAAAQECPAPPDDDSIDFGAPIEIEVATDEERHRFVVEVADEPDERARGMMFRPEVAPDQGMLFVFPEPERQSFWMRDTCASLDILYLRDDGEIESIVRHAVPFSLRRLPSSGPATGVLEIAGGRAAELGIEPGDRVIHPFLPSSDATGGEVSDGE